MEKASPLSLRQRLSGRSKTSTVPSQTNSVEEPNERFRLIRLTPQPDPSYATIAGRGEEHQVDIVAVHGLGGDPYKTWTHENGTLWLRDIAGKQLPGVRIYTFGYDSAFAFSQGTGNVRDFARSLLEALRLERASQEVWSLINPFGRFLITISRSPCVVADGAAVSLVYPKTGVHSYCF